MPDVLGAEAPLLHLPHVTEVPYENFDGTYLIRCWEQFDTRDARLRGGRILEAWVPSTQIDADQPTCLACIALGPGPVAR